MKTCLGIITHYSCLESILSPKKIVKLAKEYGYTSLGIADIHNMSGCVEFFLECKKADIKPIIGLRYKDYVIFAKNKGGYKELLSICYDINSGAKIDLEEVKTNNLRIDNAKESDLDLYSPRFLKDEKHLFDIVVATREHAKVSNIKNLLSEYEGDWFGNYDKNKVIATEKFAESCEEYDITGKPILPFYNGIEDNTEYFNKLCNQKLELEFPNKPEYKSRLQYELGVINRAKLENYFLVLMDIMQWARSQGYLLGPGRGSSGGSLVARVLDITQIDPIERDLIFERFYNEGRNTENYTAMPDIDIDVPKRSRKAITEYIISKYGEDKVSKIGTYQTLMGRSSLSAVFRAETNIGFGELKKITKNIKDKAQISDELQEMSSKTGKKSVILWGLQNEPSKFEDYCIIKDGVLVGDYAEQFSRAIDLEETKCALSEHAAGVLITRDPLRECCPMVNNHGYLITGCEMGELESIGLQKLDLLGVKTLDVLEDI